MISGQSRKMYQYLEPEPEGAICPKRSMPQALHSSPHDTLPVSRTDASIANWPGSNIQGHAMRASAPEWEPGRRDTLETLPGDFVPPFPASGRRNAGALPRNVASCQSGLWDDADDVFPLGLTDALLGQFGLELLEYG